MGKKKRTLDSVLRLMSAVNRSAIHRTTGVSLAMICKALKGQRVPGLENGLLIANEIGVTREELYRGIEKLRSELKN